MGTFLFCVIYQIKTKCFARNVEFWKYYGIVVDLPFQLIII